MAKNEFPQVAFDLEHLRDNAKSDPLWLLSMYHTMVVEFGYGGGSESDAETVFFNSECPASLGYRYLKSIVAQCNEDDLSNDPGVEIYDHERTIIELITSLAIAVEATVKGDSDGH